MMEGSSNETVEINVAELVFNAMTANLMLETALVRGGINRAARRRIMKQVTTAYKGVDEDGTIQDILSDLGVSSSTDTGEDISS